MGKPIRNAYLGTVKHDWTPIVCYWANRKPFLSARGNIWNSKVVFYNKTTCFWGADISIENYELLFLFTIISLCSDIRHLLDFAIFKPKFKLLWESWEVKFFFSKTDFKLATKVMGKIFQTNSSMHGKSSILFFRALLLVLKKNIYVESEAGN